MSLDPTLLDPSPSSAADSPGRRPGESGLKALKAYLRTWTKPPRRLTFTRAGKFFMLLTLAVGAGALNTGNNLLFLLLGMMLSAIIASGVLSEGVLRRLSAERRLPRRIFAQTPSLGALRVDNPRSYLSLNVELSELNPTALAGPRQGERVGLKDVPFWKFWVSDVFTDERYVAIVRCLEIPPRSRQELATRYLFPARGRYLLPGLRFATRFPFGLFHKVAERDLPVEVTVLPKPSPAQDWSAQVAARFGDLRQRQAGLGEEFLGLRDWREGEDPRQIHWRSSARRGHPVVREHEREEQRAVQIVLLTSVGQPRASTPSQAARFELGLSKLTALIQELHHARYRLGMSAPGALIWPSGQAQTLDALLEVLATASLSDEAAAAPPLPEDTRAGAWSGQAPGAALLGVGFRRALEASGLDYDLTLTLDELEP